MSCSCKIGGGSDGVCFECKSRRAFSARLKQLEDAKASEDYARGVAAERARVVAWLRETRDGSTDWQQESHDLLTLLAFQFERGLHDKEGT